MALLLAAVLQNAIKLQIIGSLMEAEISVYKKKRSTYITFLSSSKLFGPTLRLKTFITTEFYEDSYASFRVPIRQLALDILVDE